jgi:hypothetical protein
MDHGILLLLCIASTPTTQVGNILVHTVTKVPVVSHEFYE